MLRLYYDLHIHSCLSPCGSEDMTPANIINMAKLKNLDVIAVTDHNSCKNCPAVLSMAEQFDIIALPGMELCTVEEVHVLCLFADLKDALSFDAYVADQLIKIPNDEKIFGKQEIYNEYDEKTGDEPYLLINAAQISFDCLGNLMKEYHGIYIPAHLDRSSNSLISNLGFIPPDSSFTCAEFKDIAKAKEYIGSNPYLAGCNLITDSDAHYLEYINEPENFILTEDRSRGSIIRALSGNLSKI
jgi:hypothetical protein